jgi:hypothetical protein
MGMGNHRAGISPQIMQGSDKHLPVPSPFEVSVRPKSLVVTTVTLSQTPWAFISREKASSASSRAVCSSPLSSWRSL